ncbi:uncharacterized protein H6S33_011352 [Morchella sextelata]|uniref:uncharacterized protein n=1 Tax=Morchella sextelata TaxID=1174677 RepID=UPI001D055CF1|nr:uncharacterized protein H6S33_011352 [Morchella sextelata]KAH0610925.1 hypothetical protein H6S33_011352 [Morchella sextelata]
MGLILGRDSRTRAYKNWFSAVAKNTILDLAALSLVLSGLSTLCSSRLFFIHTREHRRPRPVTELRSHVKSSAPRYMHRAARYMPAPRRLITVVHKLIPRQQTVTWNSKRDMGIIYIKPLLYISGDDGGDGGGAGDRSFTSQIGYQSIQLQQPKSNSGYLECARGDGRRHAAFLTIGSSLWTILFARARLGPVLPTPNELTPTTQQRP